MFVVLFSVFLGWSFDDHLTTLPIKAMRPMELITVGDDSQVLRAETLLFHNRELYLSDWNENRVLQLDNQFKVKKTFGRSGDAPGEIRGAKHFFINNALLFVQSDTRREMEVFDLSGQFVQRIQLPSFTGLTNFVLDANNQIYISEPILGAEVSVFDFKGELVNQMGPIDNTRARSLNNHHVYLGLHKENDRERIITVGLIEPFIKMYRPNGSLVFQKDLSNDPYFKDLLEYKRKKARANPDAIIMTTAYVSVCEDKLLVLIHHDDSYLDLLTCDIKGDAIIPKGIFRLEHQNHSSIGAMSVTFSRETGWLAYDHDNAALIRLKPDQ